jgi:hypothetical protein
MMTSAPHDGPERLLAVALRVLPAGRRDWGRAMQAELATVEEPADRRRFARGCVRTAAVRFVLPGVVHLLVVLATLATMLAWIATLDYPRLAVMLYVLVPMLAAVCWGARRAGMLGPDGPGTPAGIVRAGGYLLAATVAAVALALGRPPAYEGADDGTGVLVLGTVAASFLIAALTVTARRSAATVRVLMTASAGGLAATVLWLVLVILIPPIPPSVGRALALAGVAAVVAVLANSGRSSTVPGVLLAALLATVVALTSTFVMLVLLAHHGPDRLIPAVTPDALPGHRISESRIEIVDPYMLVLMLGAVTATMLSAAAVVTRRPVTRRPAVRPEGIRA